MPPGLVGEGRSSEHPHEKGRGDALTPRLVCAFRTASSPSLARDAKPVPVMFANVINHSQHTIAEALQAYVNDSNVRGVLRR